MENPILTVFDETGSKKMKLESEIDETGIKCRLSVLRWYIPRSFDSTWNAELL